MNKNIFLALVLVLTLLFFGCTSKVSKKDIVVTSDNSSPKVVLNKTGTPNKTSQSSTNLDLPPLPPG